MSGPEKPWYLPALETFLLEDVPRLLGCTQRRFDRDVQTLGQRLTTEGESFLTKTLPALGRQVDLALQGARPLITPNFHKRKRGSAIPAFLQEMHRRVFHDDGWVRESPCIMSIRLLRQICFWCKKLKKGYSDESLQKALASFIEVDESLPSSESDLADSFGLLAIARRVVELVLRRIGDPSQATPRHGPGAVAGRESAVDKRALKVSYRDLERQFRPIPWFRSLRDVAQNLDEFLTREKAICGFSRTEFVEKDSYEPRTIGAEPAEYMWCQQAIKSLLYHHIEHTRQIALGRVNFTDQTINRELARNWSRYDTLDMSKASDRNSFILVKMLFQGTRIWPWLEASRTPGTVLPNGQLLIYKKFAPMGSAVCFPVEALVFWALAVAVQHMAGRPFLLACRDTYVYGDDLIVARGFFPLINEAFEKVGLKLNADKCCVAGRFRESCGLDAFDGCEVTPVRMRKSDVRDDADLVTLIEHANALMNANYWHTSVRYRELAILRFQRLADLGLPLSERTVLPFLFWRAAPWEEDTLRLKPQRKNGMMTWLTESWGWNLKPKRLKCPDVYEERNLRESLSRGGPVGHLVTSRQWFEVIGNPNVKGVWGPWSVSRELDSRYSGVLRKRKYTVG